VALKVSQLRRWFGAAAIILLLLVGAAYFYARHRLRDAIKEVPGKIGLEIQQSAQGFTISRSEQGRTLFKIQASKVVQFKQGGRAELHDVSIILYGRDSTRFDQIYGANFEYDPQSGDVTATGPVQIDLEANPQGLVNADQTTPRELKNPIHLKTTDLVFNQKTGNASTKEKIDFNTPQISGSAHGLIYTAVNNLLILESQVNVTFNGPVPATVVASRGMLTKDPRQFVLDRVRARSGARRCEADKATLSLRSDNTLERVLASGNVVAQTEDKSSGRLRAAQMELLMREGSDGIQSAVFSGDVNIETSGAQSGEANANRVAFNFLGKKSILQSARTEGDVKLVQHQRAPSGAAQDLQIRATAIDFFVAEGKRLARAETFGTGQFQIIPVQPATGQETLVTARKFLARFDELGRLQSVHAEPDARIVAKTPGEPDRISTSERLDATFRPGSGIESLLQQGTFTYTDGERKAWADRARYTLADRMISLDGSPRVADSTTDTTARTIRLNRETGDALAEGDVKSTYRDLKPQATGALLASSSPIHVTARAMTAHRSPAVVVYTGNARLWQDANILEASSIQFDREHRSVVAQGSEAQPVSTVLVQTEKNGTVMPVTITSSGLTYTDPKRLARFEGKVQAKGADLTVTAAQMDVYLKPPEQQSSNQVSATPGNIDHIIARNQVVITQPGRRASGEQLTYTAAEDKFVLTGGPPSIFDAEHGKVTGVSLTFFRADVRVLVEGNNSHPTVTQTRVAR
jgi:lipopolysaccharide export system protein LptA